MTRPVPLVRILQWAAVALVSLAALEAVLVLLRHTPSLASIGPLRGIARELYMLDRRMVQFEVDATRWDPRLGYTLRPGRFEFANTEYRTTYRVNRAGLRDDETSLEAPQIVVVGDSFAMGWGVEQDRAFPAVLEGLSNRRVLNSAVASWGTARQLRLLSTLDLGSTTHLIIQFCNNDYFENLAFERQGPDFATVSREGWHAAVADYRRMRHYWPGRYTVSLLGRRLKPGDAGPAHPDPTDPAAQRRQAELLLGVLRDSPVDLSRLEIILFELNSHNRHAGRFLPVLERVVAEGDWPAVIKGMTVVDLASELGPELWYRLDDHLTAAGHDAVARRLWEIIESLPPAREGD